MTLEQKSHKENVLHALVSNDGRKMSLFQIYQEIESEPCYARELKDLSVNDIFNYAEKEKLITILKK